MVEHGGGAEDIQQGRAASWTGCWNFNEHWKGLTWGWLRKLVKGDVLHLYLFYFWRNLPTYLFIFTSLPEMPWFWLFFQGLSLHISRWFWLNFMRIQCSAMCSQSHGKLTHCSKFWHCCLIHKVGEGFNKCLFMCVATLTVNLCFHWWENCRWYNYTSDTI